MVNKQLTQKHMPKKQTHKVTPIGMIGKEPLVLPNYSGVEKFSNERDMFSPSSHTHDTTYLKLDGSNANQTINIGSEDFYTTGIGVFGNLDVDTLNLQNNAITDSTGTITFNDENLVTTGILSVPQINDTNTDILGFNTAAVVGTGITTTYLNTTDGTDSFGVNATLNDTSDIPLSSGVVESTALKFTHDWSGDVISGFKQSSSLNQRGIFADVTCDADTDDAPVKVWGGDFTTTWTGSVTNTAPVTITGIQAKATGSIGQSVSGNDHKHIGAEITANSTSDLNVGIDLSSAGSLGGGTYANIGIDASGGGDLFANYTRDGVFAVLGSGSDAQIQFDGSDLLIQSNNITANDELKFVDWKNVDCSTATLIAGGGLFNGDVLLDDGNLKFTGTSKIEWNKESANGVTLTNFTSASSVSDLQNANDGNVYTATEVAGGNNSLIVDFTGIEGFNWVKVLAYYDGNSVHNQQIQIEASPFDNSTWHTFDSIEHQGATTNTFQNHDFLVPSSHAYINSGVVKIRFLHSSSTSNGHTLVMDEVSLYQ